MLLLCVAYGSLRKDRRFLHAYCLLSPIYMLLLLFYVLPQDYSEITAIHVTFLAQIYGEDGSGPVIVILMTCVIVLYSVLSWQYAWNRAVKVSTKRYHNNGMFDAESELDDHPYHRKSCASYL